MQNKACILMLFIYATRLMLSYDIFIWLPRNKKEQTDKKEEQASLPTKKFPSHSTCIVDDTNYLPICEHNVQQNIFFEMLNFKVQHLRLLSSGW